MQSQLKNSLEYILVDDNYIDQFLVKKLLQNEGYQKPALCFTEAAGALVHLQHATVKKDIPSVILLDINMPVMNGFEFLESYRGLPKTIRDHYTIIMLSSSFSEDDIAKANADPHVKYYIIKPLTAQKLEGALVRLGLLTTG